MDHQLQIDRDRLMRWILIGTSALFLVWMIFRPPDPSLDKPVPNGGPCSDSHLRSMLG